MTFFPKRPIASLALPAFLIVLLIVLATLQYRWSNQISESVRERMQLSLDNSMQQFKQQYSNELRQLATAFQPDVAILMQMNWKRYAENCSAAMSSSEGNLVRNIYLWTGTGEKQPRLLRLNRTIHEFQPIDWPSYLAFIRERYAETFRNSPQSGPRFPRFSWIMFNRAPILLRQLDNGPPGIPGEIRMTGFLMIELDREAIKSTLLPEVARRTFGDPDGSIYNLAVLDESSGEIIYRSDLNLTLESFDESDARLDLLDRVRQPDRARESMDMRMPRRDMGPPEQGDLRLPSMRMPPRSSSSPPWGFAPIFFEVDDDNWTLVVKHREGSLEAAVERLRLRNLAISFGSLLLLAASMALIVSSARRAQRLARLQLEFVAGISHELRTPLAVICSAGDNLAEGVVAETSPAAQKYGKLIRDEGRKLAAMIERILQFAGLQRGSRRQKLRPVHLNDIVEFALKEAESAITAAGFSVERNFASGLSMIKADPDALSQVIQNLIQNAIKYSRESRVLIMQTEAIAGKRRPTICLSIEDHGIGIDDEDMPHIFEPFYRGKMALSEQIHGAGLGLYLVRETLAAMGAKIQAKSDPGKGSKFTMCFDPASDNPSDNPGQASSSDPSDGHGHDGHGHDGHGQASSSERQVGNGI